MFSLEHCSDQELLNILRCNKLKELYDHLDEDKAKNLITNISNLGLRRPIPSKITQALLVPITDTSSYPFILLGSIIGLVSGGTLPLLISTGVILFTSLSIGGFFFYANYKEIQKKEDTVNRLLHLTELKNHVAEMFLRRQGLKIQIIEAPIYSDKHELSLLKGAVRSCMVISTTLFGTYFIGLNAVFSALGFSLISASMGPIGVIIGLGIALSLGIYFGYKHYQMLKQDDYFKFEQKCQEVIVGKKISLCQNLKTDELDKSPLGEIQKTKPIYSTNKDKSKNTFLFTLNKLNNVFFRPSTEPNDEALQDRLGHDPKLNPSLN